MKCKFLNLNLKNFKDYHSLYPFSIFLFILLSSVDKISIYIHNIYIFFNLIYYLLLYRSFNVFIDEIYIVNFDCHGYIQSLERL